MGSFVKGLPASGPPARAHAVSRRDALTGARPRPAIDGHGLFGARGAAQGCGKPRQAGNSPGPARQCGRWPAEADMPCRACPHRNAAAMPANGARVRPERCRSCSGVDRDALRKVALRTAHPAFALFRHPCRAQSSAVFSAFREVFVPIRLHSPGGYLRKVRRPSHLRGAQGDSPVADQPEQGSGQSMDPALPEPCGPLPEERVLPRALSDRNSPVHKRGDTRAFVKSVS